MSVFEVLPSDSASASGDRFVDSGLEALLAKLSCIKPNSCDFDRFFPDPAVICEIADKHGVQFASSIVQFYEKSKESVRSCMGLQHAMIRTVTNAAAGGVSSVASSNVGSNGSGFSGPRVRTSSYSSPIARGSTRLPRSPRRRSPALDAPSWRASSPVEDGLCYLKMFKRTHAVGVAERLGMWPTIEKILLESSDSIESLAVLERFRITGPSDKAHLAAGGQNGLSLLSELSAMARSMVVVEGTVGSALQESYPCSGTIPEVYSRETMLGGVNNWSRYLVYGIKDGCEPQVFQQLNRLSPLRVNDVVFTMEPSTTVPTVDSRFLSSHGGMTSYPVCTGSFRFGGKDVGTNDFLYDIAALARQLGLVVSPYNRRDYSMVEVAGSADGLRRFARSSGWTVVTRRNNSSIVFSVTAMSLASI